MKKAFLALAMAALLVAMFAVPALAATADFPLPAPFANGTQGQWNMVGTDGATDGLDPAIFIGATKLIVEMPEIESGVMCALGGPGNWWVEVKNAVYADGAYTFDLTAASPSTDVIYDQSGESKGGYVVFGDASWGTPFADLGVTKVTWQYGSGGAAAGDSGSGTAAKTGDSTFIWLAIGAFVFAAGAAVFVTRKVKA